MIESCWWGLSTESESCFCLRNEPALSPSFLPQHQQQPAERRCWSQGTDVLPSQGNPLCPLDIQCLFLRTPPTWGQKKPSHQRQGKISGFQVSLLRIPVAILSSPAGSLPAESCFVLWALTHRLTEVWSWHRMHNGEFCKSVQGDLLISPWPEEQLFRYENPLSPQHTPPPLTYVLWAEIPQTLALYKPWKHHLHSFSNLYKELEPKKEARGSLLKNKTVGALCNHRVYGALVLQLHGNCCLLEPWKMFKAKLQEHLVVLKGTHAVVWFSL